MIGNGAYRNVRPLPNPPRDAADVSAALKRLNFSVTTLIDATAGEMRHELDDFGKAATDSEMAVVFYAGHGMEAGGQNWLIPVDARLETNDAPQSEAVDLKSILAQVSKTRTLGLVILDACRDNPFVGRSIASTEAVNNSNPASRGRSIGRGLAPTEPTGNVLVAFAARDGTIADDGDGRNSPFTKAFLRHVETPGLEVTFLFRNVRDDVMSATNGAQQPFVYGSLSKKEIYFKPLPAATVPINLTALEEAANQPANPLFKPADEKRIAEIASQKQFILPLYQINKVADEVPERFRRFVGIWSSRVGFNGSGRHAMLIVTSISNEGDLAGYYVWAPPTPNAYDPKPAGYATIVGKIKGDTFTFGFPQMTNTVTLVQGRSMRLRADYKSGFTASIDLLPVWTIAAAR